MKNRGLRQCARNADDGREQAIHFLKIEFCELMFEDLVAILNG